MYTYFTHRKTREFIHENIAILPIPVQFDSPEAITLLSNGSYFPPLSHRANGQQRQCLSTVATENQAQE